MDKREYQEKLQEINQLIAVEDYEGAAKVADSIDWKRVRNVQTLVMISEVYEAVERYEDSKILLLRAYRRSPVGRTVLYRLVECCIKLRQFDQAIEYYSEYVQAAPHDNNKFILKYKIYRGRGASLEEQIDILKEYLDQEYNEKWAYELARLEIQAGRVQEGLATCDDLVLWFHSGKYVIKALELKKKYAPLTPKQQEIYDHRFEHEEEPEIVPESYLSEAASLAKAERAAAAQDEIKSELAADISQTARVEATKSELKRKAEQAEAEIDRKAAASRRALAEPQAEAPAPEDAAKHAAAPHAASAPVTGAAAEAASGTAVPETEKAEEPMLASAPAAAVVTGAAAAEAVSEAAAPEAVSEAAVPETAGAEEPISPAAPAAEKTEEPMFASAPETAGVEEPISPAAPAVAVVSGAAAAPSVSEAAAPETAGAEEPISPAAPAVAVVSGAAAAPETAGAEEPISPAAPAAAVVTGTVAAETEKEEESMSTAAAGEEKTLPAESRAASAPPSDEAFAEAAREAVSELAEGKIPADAAGTESETVPEEIRQEAPADVASEIEPSAGASAQEELSSEASEEEPAGAEEKWSAGAAVAATLAGAAVAATIAGAASEEASAGSASEREETGMPEREKLQEDMVRNMREIVSGVGPKAQISEEEAILENAIDQSKEDQEMAVAARGSDMTFRVPESEASQKRQAGRLTIDDILLSMGDRGEHVRKVTGGSVMSASEESQMSDQPEIPRFLRDDVHEARQTAEIPAAVIAGADDAFRTERGIAGREETDGYGSPSDGAWTGADAARGNAVQETGTAQTPADGAGWDGSAGSVRKTSPAEETMDPLQDPEAAAAAAAFMSTQRVPYTREIAEAKTRRLPVEEIRKLHEAYLSESAAAAEEASKNVSQTAERAAEMAEAEAAMMNGLPDRAGFTDTPADKAAGPGGPAFRDRMPKEAAGRSASADEPAGRPAVPDEPAEKPAKKPSRWSLFSRKSSGKAAKTNEPSGRAAAPNVPAGRTALPEDDDIRIAGAPGSNSGTAGIAAAGLASSGMAAAAAGADAPSDKPQNDAGKGGAAAGIAAAAGLAAVGVAAAAADTDESSEKPQREEAKGGAAAGIAAAAGLAAVGVAAAAADTDDSSEKPQREEMGYGAGSAPAAGAPAFDMAGAPADRQQREEMGYGAVRRGPIGEQVMREVPKSEPEPQLFTGRPQLKAGQMELFRGFTSIGNLSEQIAGAIWQAENRKDNRTSRTGNILILGAHGCGKTTIATGIAKAIAEDKGSHSVKMARIYAADLNRKDIAATIAKIAGGVLIVEEAGDLDDAIVDQLTTAMEFRTDGLIIILEDEQRYIHELLMRHPRFTMKFTAQIYIPEYTEDDLTGFGMIYAESKDYVFSEGAVEACRARIEAARKNGEPVSVTNVIELVDRAIKGADSFFRRIGSAKKRYDEQDRIILREKDFR